MYTYAVYKVITDMKALKLSEGKRVFRGLIKKSPLFQGGVEGFIVSFWPQSWSQRCFKRKTPKLTFRPQSKTDCLVKKKKNDGGKKEGTRIYRLLRRKKKEDMALIVEKEENQEVCRNILALYQCLNISSLS